MVHNTLQYLQHAEMHHTKIGRTSPCTPTGPEGICLRLITQNQSTKVHFGLQFNTPPQKQW